jgi:hypothetical protein
VLRANISELQEVYSESKIVFGVFCLEMVFVASLPLLFVYGVRALQPPEETAIPLLAGICVGVGFAVWFILIREAAFERLAKKYLDDEMVE